MSRPKKNPEERRVEFINAARQLFFTKGYNTTSIQDILDAVGDKSCSPSVFYYYFKSKEEIYHSVMETYCDEYTELIEKSLMDNQLGTEEQIVATIKVMTETLLASIDKIDRSNSVENRLFALDLRERTTHKIIQIMAEAMNNTFPKKTEAYNKNISTFIAGGVGEMLNSVVFNENAQIDDINKTMIDIVNFTTDLLGVPKLLQKRILKRI
ncbi:MAG: TetR/AcrR family transcriptional regulator [Spirochaetales bacterium]|nr:TetR/AcrR family transcriptional regulator [Spirochaetales bacterium]